MLYAWYPTLRPVLRRLRLDIHFLHRATREDSDQEKIGIMAQRHREDEGKREIWKEN
jgi:hypothetical protein